MKLSIIIPTKNEEQNLPVLLAALRAQTLFRRLPQEIEIIVADAHSTDATRSLATQAGARVVDGGMPGPGRNRGAEAATGEWLAFFDADVTLPALDYLEKCLAELTERRLDVATCDLKPMEGSLGDRMSHGGYNLFTRLTQSLVAHAGGSCIFAKRELHKKIGGFDETVIFAEDMEYVQRAQKNGGRFRVLNAYPMLVSVRRIAKEGYLLFIWKLVYAECYMRFVGPIRKPLFTYEFGNFKK